MNGLAKNASLYWLFIILSNLAVLSYLCRKTFRFVFIFLSFTFNYTHYVQTSYSNQHGLHLKLFHWTPALRAWVFITLSWYNCLNKNASFLRTKVVTFIVFNHARENASSFLLIAIYLQNICGNLWDSLCLPPRLMSRLTPRKSKPK